MDTDCPPKLLPPYAAHTQVFFSLKINFRSFFFVYMRAMPSRRVVMLYLRTPPVYGHSYFTIVQRLPLHIPPKLLPPYAAHTQVFFSLKINFRPKHLCMCGLCPRVEWQCCTFGRRLRCAHSPEATATLRSPFANKFRLKVNFSLICLQMCIFFCTFAR